MWEFHPASCRAWSSDRGASYLQGPLPKAALPFTPTAACTQWRGRCKKNHNCCFQTSHSHWNSSWICVPRYSFKKHVTVSGGVTGRGAHNLYPKSEQSQKMSWPKDSGREMGHVMKTHKSVPQQPWMPRLSDTLSESWTSGYHFFCFKLTTWVGNFSPAHITAYSLKHSLGLYITNSSAKRCTPRQLSLLCLPWLNSGDSGEAAVQKPSLSPWTVLPLQPDWWHVK